MTVPEPLDGLTSAQARAVTHGVGPLAVLGGPGTGRTRVLVERFGHLVEERGVAPEVVLLLAPSTPAADELRTLCELRLGDAPFEELAAGTVPAFALRLLREEAVEAHLGAFTAVASRADRLAVLLAHVDELPLELHDLGGRPAGVLGRVLARIDRVKQEGTSAAEHRAWALTLDPALESTPRERELAALHDAHDRLLAAEGLLAEAEVVLRADWLLRTRAHVRARTAARLRHVLVDDHQDLVPAQVRLVSRLAAEHGRLLATLDPGAALAEGARDGARTLRALRRAHPDLEELVLDESLRCTAPALAAIDALAGADAPSARQGGLDRPRHDPADRAHPLPGAPALTPAVRAWTCTTDRAEAQAVAAEAERLVRAGVAPERIGILLPSVREGAPAITAALEERALPFRLLAGMALFARTEVRDVLAWLRVLVDPSDAPAATRALARPPVELRAADLARCLQIARRRKLDMVAALAAATESPQLPPEARERILWFLKLHRQASAALDTTRPDLFVHRLIDRLELRRQGLFAAQAEVVERLVGLARLGELALQHAQRSPQATAREFAVALAAAAEAGVDDDPDALPDRARPREGAIGVLALHATAGLEFDHVLVCGLDAGRLPGRAPDPEAEPPEALRDGAGAPDEPEPDLHAAHDARGRRLLALALGRARHGVVLSCATAAGAGSAGRRPSPLADEAREAAGARWELREEELYGPDEALHATFASLRDELLREVATIGTRLGELRLDTDLDVTHGVTRYLELVKVASLLQRPAGQDVGDALRDVNARLAQAASPAQREALETSGLDELLLSAESDRGRRAAALAGPTEPSLAAFLPTRGEGLVLSASDIETYRACPLRYKFARVFRIPSEPTLNQRFGILVHHVLERFHETHAGATGARQGSRDELLGLLEAGWRRGGFGDSAQERQFRPKAVAALERYHERLATEEGEPVWLEKAFQFKLGRHVLRGRVDRVDRLPGGGYELIDYKTGRPRTAEQLREDVQLSLYAVAAREAWQLESSREAYHYVLDDEKVRVPSEAMDPGWIEDTVGEVAGGILAQGFEPTPSRSACGMCDYRITCPAAER